ncbi:hypothetical protein PENTCL1PPCAC_25002 [Pristionchus entomophagus]|uniref:EamA domain-containing protein n=1 Tax=Pristionchus entomophagus TaxID=358040 RepID=A0AAV5U8Y7_9BILA|nr:hypothetical protein PENTCL1PPCAC_25002 [Pristionchus entomophagus]
MDTSNNNNVTTEAGVLLEKGMKSDKYSLRSLRSVRKEEDEEHEDEEGLPARKLLLSLLVIFGVAIAWIASTRFSKAALIVDPRKFNAPCFMLWWNTNWMITCFPAFLLYNRIRGVKATESFEDSVPVLGGSLQTAVGRVALFLFLWSGANYSYLKALAYVSASVATSIQACNVSLVWLMAIFLLGDRFIPPKLFAVFLAIAGVVLISLDKEIRASWIGILLSTLSPIFAAVYKVMFKWILGDATLGQVSLFMTCIGLLNFFVNAIPALLLIIFDVERMEISAVPWLVLIGAGFLGLLFNFLINFGIALLHPLVISVGMLVGLPCNTVIDIVFSSVSPTPFFISGSICVFISFILIVFPYSLVPICRRLRLASHFH